MDVDQIRVHLRKVPFVPFRIVMVDGSSHEILVPEFARVLGKQLVVGEPQVIGEIPRRTVLYDLAQVTGIELLVETSLQLMNAEQLIAHLRAQPFLPFRMFMSDGASYEVRHPELAMVGRREVVVALPQVRDRPIDRFAYCDPLHITRIEPIDTSVPQS
jgi:hypothetical protein